MAQPLSFLIRVWRREKQIKILCFCLHVRRISSQVVQQVSHQRISLVESGQYID